MINSTVQTALIRHMVGPVSQRKKSISKGCFLGFLSFMIFEFASTVNPNLPRIPASWLLTVTILIAQIALFIKIARFLRHPRSEDFFFVIAMNHTQRNWLTCSAFETVHKAIIPFVYSSLSIIVSLEFIIIKERSFINLLLVPVAGIASIWILYVTLMNLLKKGLVKPSNKDECHSDGSVFSKKIFSAVFSSIIVKLSTSVAKISSAKIRPYVTRNFMYLLRCDPLQFMLFTFAAPVLLCLFMFLIGSSMSSFMEFFTILSVFILNCYYSAALREAVIKQKECFYYLYDSGIIIKAYLFTVLTLSIPYIIIFLGMVNVHLFTVNGILRLFTFSLSLIATFFINCRAVLQPQRKDSESATDFLLFFITIAPGLFIPLFGWIFPVFSIMATLLLEWERVFGNKVIPIKNQSS